jgi:hypothetical protein
MPNVLLHAPQDFRNLCVLARTLEVFGHRECYVFDPRRLVRERYGKSRTREMRVVSAGAFSKIHWQRIEDAGTIPRGLWGARHRDSREPASHRAYALRISARRFATIRLRKPRAAAGSRR